MRIIFDLLRLLVLLVSAAARTWWAFLGESGVEADDPDKERER